MCLIMLNFFQKLGVSCANKFHDRRVEYAMNAFGARVMHASIRHMRFQIL